ncbi:MAG: NTPase KAP [Flammeovirgaceae bacterium]|nr:NTPase KAP [Flammeovirgaceae bacterium]
MEFSIDIPSKEFKKHIEIEDNDRIIFSGRFGIGKTHFLDRFFDVNSDNYEAIHIYPVNYSVASNEDIFELIKYDIFYELINKENLDFKKIDTSKVFTLMGYSAKNSHKFLAPFLTLLPVLGKSLLNIYDRLEILLQDFNEIHDHSQIDELNDIKSFFDKFNLDQGSLYENDFYTELINELVLRLKENDSKSLAKDENYKKKEVVLIIDDLDRIDPEHIFRILNVISAHNDQYKEPKFNFDKIIVVCDIENIQKIYHHRYGLDVDFFGYIDKFYADDVFRFENSDGISEQIVAFIRDEIKFENIENNFDFTTLNPNINARMDALNLAYILTAMVKVNVITIRILKRIGKDIEVPNRRLNLKINKNLSSHEFIGIIIIDFFKKMLGGYEPLIEAIKLCSDFKTNFFLPEYRREYIDFLLPILDYEKHQFRQTSEKFTYQSKESKQKIEYNVRYSERRFNCDISDIKRLDNSNDIIQDHEVNYFGVLLETIEKCFKENI